MYAPGRRKKTSPAKIIILSILAIIVAAVVGTFIWLTDVEKNAPTFVYNKIAPNDFEDAILDTMAYNTESKDIKFLVGHNMINSILDELAIEAAEQLPNNTELTSINFDTNKSRIYIKGGAYSIATTIMVPVELTTQGSIIHIKWDKAYIGRVPLPDFLTKNVPDEYKDISFNFNSLGLPRGMNITDATVQSNGVLLSIGVSESFLAEPIRYQPELIQNWLRDYATMHPEKLSVYQLSVDTFNGNYVDDEKLIELTKEVMDIEELTTDLIDGYIDYMRRNGR